MNGARILLTTAGRKSYLARILRASSYAEHVVAVDSDPLSPVRRYADHFEVVPSIENGEAFLEAIRTLCRNHGIHCVMPQNDRELAILACARSELADDGVRVAGVSAERVPIVADKYALGDWLRERGYDYPRTWLAHPTCDRGLRFVEKSRSGQGSEGLVYFDDSQDAVLASGKIVQERIEGDEFNLDVLRDSAGQVVATSVKRKLLMRDGSTDRAVSVRSAALEALGARLADDLEVFGSIDVDLIVDPDGRPFVLDVNPRIGGGFPFTAEFFPSYVDALLRVCMGGAVDALQDGYEPDVYVYRDYSFASAPGRWPDPFDETRNLCRSSLERSLET